MRPSCPAESYFNAHGSNLCIVGARCLVQTQPAQVAASRAAGHRRASGTSRSRSCGTRASVCWDVLHAGIAVGSGTKMTMVGAMGAHGERVAGIAQTGASTAAGRPARFAARVHGASFWAQRGKALPPRGPHLSDRVGTMGTAARKDRGDISLGSSQAWSRRVGSS